MTLTTTEVIALIKHERERQVTAEGYSVEHDDLHKDGELAKAAACYAVGDDLLSDYGDGEGNEVWPWEGVAAEAVEDKPRVRQLVIAAALIVAEIERLLRAERR